MFLAASLASRSWVVLFYRSLVPAQILDQLRRPDRRIKTRIVARPTIAVSLLDIPLRGAACSGFEFLASAALTDFFFVLSLHAPVPGS